MLVQRWLRPEACLDFLSTPHTHKLEHNLPREQHFSAHLQLNDVPESSSHSGDLEGLTNIINMLLTKLFILLNGLQLKTRFATFHDVSCLLLWVSLDLCWQSCMPGLA